MSIILRLFLRLAVIFLSLLAADYLVGDITIRDSHAALWAALWLGIVHSTVRPIVKLISLPITLLTLGLFVLVINGLMMILVARFVSGFEVYGLWAAIKGAVVVSLVGWLLDILAIRRLGTQDLP